MSITFMGKSFTKRLMAPAKKTLATLFFLTVCGSTSAKCAPELFSFSGVVLNGVGKPLSGALVGISWLERSGVAGPALAQTDKNGKYTIFIAFDTYSGKGVVAEDQCNKKIVTVSLAAQKKGLRSPYRRISVTAPGNIRVRTVKVSLKIDEKPGVLLVRPGQ